MRKVLTTDSKEHISIRNVFDQKRDPLRPLNAIVKVFDLKPENIWIEFEEFVLTEKLLEYLYNFHESFSKPVRETQMPFWLEGFYGSGKSHFSKMIGLLFWNVDLKTPIGESTTAIEFLTNTILPETLFTSEEANKKKNELITSINLFPKRFKCKTILINLAKYSRSEAKAKEYLQSFSYALMSEFNEFLRLADEIVMAEVEKSLIKEELYDRFKEETQKLHNTPWEEIRKSTPWARSTFIKVYPKLKGESEIQAQEYMKGAELQCQQKNIEDVLEEINHWAIKNLSNPVAGIEAKALIVFDEAGIFFSASNSRIGELLSASEWVDTSKNESRINMIFNAQQSLKKHLEKAETDIDYRKAEQRFKRWFLGKENIKTVVVKRWLKKDSHTPAKKLQELIDAKYPSIIDATMIETIKDPKQEYIKPKRDEIFETYPFLPYQFPMMIQITQKLIEERVVEEEYGGQSRSILVMTRDVLNNKIPYSDKLHFVDEKYTSFVTSSQIFDSLLYTLKQRSEDQFNLVHKTELLNEKEQKVFTPEELELPVSFNDVAKTIYLFRFVEEIYANDENVAKALFNSVKISPNLYLEKVKKLIDILKKKGYISYTRRDITDDEGNTKEIWEYKIATEEEMKFTEFSFRYPANKNDIQKTFFDFFKEGEGKALINFKDQINLPTIIGKANQEFKLKTAIKRKLSWIIDPDLDTLLGQMEENKVSICLVSPLYLLKKDLSSLERQITVLIKKAFNKQKMLFFITPSLNQTTDMVERMYDYLEDNLKQIYQIDQGFSNFNPSTIVVQTFLHRKEDIEKEILKQLTTIYREGLVFYSDGIQTKIGKDNIDSIILNSLKETFSKINNYGYLGQVNISKNDIKTILTWDPKKKVAISKYLKKPPKNEPEYIPLFSESDDLQPNQSEQYAHLDREFKNFQRKGATEVSGSKFFEIFTNSPYSWNEVTILTTIAALIKNNEWEVKQNNQIKNPDDEEIITAFIDPKKKYEKFQDLKFLVAEKLTQEQLMIAKDILEKVFNQAITSPGYDLVNEGIITSFNELDLLFAGVKSDIEHLEFKNDFLNDINKFQTLTSSVLESKRQIERIRKFLSTFEPIINDDSKFNAYKETRKFLYRLKELKEKNNLNKYLYIKEFLNTSFTDWINTESDISNKNQLINDQKDSLQSLEDPSILYEENWRKFWQKISPVWRNYWQMYQMLHKKVMKNIETNLQTIEQDTNYSKLEKKKVDEFTTIFTCTASIDIPTEVNTKQFICNQCKCSYSVLKFREQQIKQKTEGIKALLKAISAEPSDQEKRSWEAYKSFHEKIETLISDLKKQRELFSDNADKLHEVDALKKHLSFDFSQYSLDHTCSEKPVNWSYDQQKCTECNYLYDELIELEHYLRTKLEEIIPDDFVTLPIEEKLTIEYQTEKDLKNILKEKEIEISKLLSKYLTQSKKQKDNFEITIKIERGN